MALSTEELANIRRPLREATFARGSGAEQTRWRSRTKSFFDPVIQTVDQWLTNGITSRPATSLSAAIDATTAPVTLTAAEKRRLVLAVLASRVARRV